MDCKYCWKFVINDGARRSGYVKEDHERRCNSNPDSHQNIQKRKNEQLQKDIEICKTQAEISTCLNCQRYQKECSGTDKR